MTCPKAGEIAWGALRRVKLQGGETIAIFGQGPVGLSATQLALILDHPAGASATMASTNKCLAQSNKSRTKAKATKSGPH